jgi:glycosyltransferase involved in cell wall biosynthesis
MRILFCCEFYAPSFGGVQKVVQEIAERLVQRGHSATVATTKLKKRNFDELNGVRIKEFRVSGNLIRGLEGDLESYRKFVISEPFDAIVIKAAQQWTFDALWPVLPQITCRKIHIPCGYSSFHEPTYQEYYRQMPQVLRQFDHLIFYATEYRDIDFAKSHGITNYSVIPNGASELEFAEPPRLDFRKKYGIREGDFIFLTVGHPRFQKGQLEVAQAYERVKLPMASVLILNDRPNRDYFSRTVPFPDKIKGFPRAFVNHHRYPLKDFRRALRNIRRQDGKEVRVTNLERQEVVSAFFSSDLFVFASYVEYSPLVLFESAAAGLPFLSVPVGNAYEIAAWTQGGEICPAEYDEKGNVRVDPEVLAQEMEDLASDTQRLRHLGEQGKENWKDKYSWSKIASAYERVLMGSICSSIL